MCHTSADIAIEIVAAVRAGDPDRAAAVMTSQIRNARAVMVRAAEANIRGRQDQEDG